MVVWNIPYLFFRMLVASFNAFLAFWVLMCADIDNLSEERAHIWKSWISSICADYESYKNIAYLADSFVNLVDVHLFGWSFHQYDHTVFEDWNSREKNKHSEQNCHNRVSDMPLRFEEDDNSNDDDTYRLYDITYHVNYRSTNIHVFV